MKTKIRGLLILLCLVLLVSFSLPAVASEYSFVNDADAIEKAADSVFMLEVYSPGKQKIGVGSGFIAFDSSLLVTNYHVIEDGAFVIAISDEKEQYVIQNVCIYDKKKDIAILMFEGKTSFEPLKLDGTSELKRSQPVVAIGSPAGLRNTVSIGNISAFYQKDGKDWIQFTAPISSGSSGGALFNDQGKIIGMTTATYATAQNINMAVKAQAIIDLYEKWNGKAAISMSNASGLSTLPVIQSESISATDNTTVYVSSGGKKYHNNATCSKMKNPIAIDLMEAIEKGYEPCGKCYK